MQKPVKILWGFGTLIPLGLMFLGLVLTLVLAVKNAPSDNGADAADGITNPDDFLSGVVGVLFLLWFLSAFLVKVSYFIHLVRSESMDKNQRTLWAILFLVFSTVTTVIYWFMHVWPEPETALKRPRRRRA